MEDPMTRILGSNIAFYWSHLLSKQTTRVEINEGSWLS